MNITSMLLLAGAGFISGVMNSLAGGGSFLAFPVLIFLGLPPINANGTATVALWPGTFATVWAYRRELKKHTHKLPVLVAISIIGGAIGAITVLHISNSVFGGMVAYLLLIASLLFTFRGRIITWVGSHSDEKPASRSFRALIFFLMFIVSVYNGFFGAGFGIMMLAVLGMSGMQQIHEMNAVRSTMGLVSNSVAIIVFVSSGIIYWQHAAWMAAGAIVGGYGGASVARTLPQKWSRNTVIALGWGMTGYFFYKKWVG